MKKLSELLAEFNLPLQRFTIESTDALSPENEYDMEGPILKHYDNYSTMTAKTSLDIVMVAHFLKSYFFVKSQAVFLDNLPFSSISIDGVSIHQLDSKEMAMLVKSKMIRLEWEPGDFPPNYQYIFSPIRYSNTFNFLRSINFRRISKNLMILFW